MKIYNADKIVCVEVEDFVAEWQYFWQNYEKATFWNKEVKEGWININDCPDYKIYTKEHLIGLGYTFIDGKPCNNPRVYITFVDKTWIQKIFNTFQEARDYAETLTDKFKHKIEA